MTLPNELLPVGLLGAGAADYEIERSLRFNSADTAYLSRTPASAGNRKTWTWAGWVKRSTLTSFQLIFGTSDASFYNGTYFFLNNDDTLRVEEYGPSNVTWQLKTTQVFRDTSDWAHLQIACDTTQSTASNRVRIYLNGVQITTLSTANYPTQNLDTLMNTTAAHGLGRAGTLNSYYFNGYLADIHFIDGQALDPTSFGEFDENGIWQPKRYAGTYGTNGFKLDFSDNSAATATTLGADSSGNGNNWTPFNLSVSSPPSVSIPSGPQEGTAYANLWNGAISSYPSDFLTARDGQIITIRWPAPFAGITKIEYYSYNGDDRHNVNNSGWSNSGSGAGWKTAYDSTAIALISLQLQKADQVSYVKIGAIRINGSTILTTSNYAVAGGPNSDSLIDVPTNGIEEDTGLGSEVRGNYCTLNPLASDAASQLSNGNLVFSGSSSLNWKYANATIGVSSGKWYWEAVCTDNSQIGIVAAISLSTESKTTGTITFRVGNYWVDGAQTSTTTFTAGNFIGFALDLESSTKTLKQYDNGVLRNTINIPVNATWNNANVFAGTAVYSTSYIDTFNFGQRPFAYTAPSGFKALNTANLPTPTILDGSEYMDVVTYTGNGSTQTISGLEFSPDLVWIKNRAQADNHKLLDTVRGATNELESNTTDAEVANADGLTAFNSDGFALGADVEYNTNNEAYVAWAWDAGSTTVTNTTGEITSSVRANPTAGFSIVSWTSDGFAGIRTMGTGLGAEPYFIIVKNRDAVDNWFIYHNKLGINSRLFFTTGSSVTITGQWSVSSSTFGIRQSSIASNGAKCIAYCFAPVTGYSSFGSYVGSTSQPFVYLGFRPKVVWIKFVSGGAITSYTSWFISDSERDTNNPQNGTGVLWANRSDAEGKRGDGTTGGSFLDIDFLSNGFRVLDQTNVAELNYTGATYIYAAWAENPFSISRAR